MTASPVYLLPGWQNSGPTHWQSAWESALGALRVEQADWQWPLRGDWMSRLEQTLLDDERLATRPAVLVAHSLGCHLVAAWAAHTRHAERVRAALLVAPPDVERPDTPPQVRSWRPMVQERLPFPATLVFSADDPYCSEARSLALAQRWGAVPHGIGRFGHVNAESGLGAWPEGQALLQALCGQA